MTYASSFCRAWIAAFGYPCSGVATPSAVRLARQAIVVFAHSGVVGRELGRFAVLLQRRTAVAILLEEHAQAYVHPGQPRFQPRHDTVFGHRPVEVLLRLQSPAEFGVGRIPILSQACCLAKFRDGLGSVFRPNKLNSQPQAGVGVLPTGADTIRAVTNLEVSRPDIERTVGIFKQVLGN